MGNGAYSLLGLCILGVAILAVAVFVVARRRSPAANEKVRHRYARRQPLLEDRILDAMDPPRQRYGDIFSRYLVLRRERTSSLEINSTPTWAALNEFTRSLVLRHLWRAMERLSPNSIVVVDVPVQKWSRAIDEVFDDKGVDPWSPPKPPTKPQIPAARPGSEDYY